jgi:hypothetical protein
VAGGGAADRRVLQAGSAVLLAPFSRGDRTQSLDPAQRERKQC